MDASHRFRLQCQHCRYTEFSTGLSTDLKHLTEHKKGSLYRGPRLFKCPRCAQLVKLLRIQPNAPAEAYRPEPPTAEK